MAVLSVDLGGTRMRAAIVDPDGTVRERRVLPTPRTDTCADALFALIDNLSGREEVGGAVIGVPGRVDYESGRVVYAPNLPASWLGDLTEATLEPHVGFRPSLANDADLAAVGEALMGAGRNHRDVVYITISTGVGAGVVLGGRLVRARLSLAELGHTVIDSASMLAGGGGTVEELASGSAIARDARLAGLAVDAAGLRELAEAGNLAAGSIWNRAMAAAAIAIANMIQLFSPDIVVIGGGVGSSGLAVLAALKGHLAELPLPGLDRSVDIVGAALGDDAGLVGAAAWSSALGVEDPAANGSGGSAGRRGR